MLQQLHIGQLSVRLAASSKDRQKSASLRSRFFVPKASEVPNRDWDRFDQEFDHILVETKPGGALVATMRVKILKNITDAAKGYSGSFYDISPIFSLNEKVMEIGRLCVAERQLVPDVMRALWAFVVLCGEDAGCATVIGCTSFRGTKTTEYAHAFGYLAKFATGPKALVPKISSSNYALFRTVGASEFDRKKAMQQMPALLRSYLNLGAWVGDHAVIDFDMGTIHVFTALEMTRIPPLKLRRLHNVYSIG